MVRERKHHHPILGLNGRMDTLQAAILLEIFKLFPEEVKLRQKIGDLYSNGLSKLEFLQTPVVENDNSSVFAQYTILSQNRESIQKVLKDKDIPSVSYYSVPMHLQPVFGELGYKVGDFPNAEKVANHCLSLPMSPYLSEEEQEKVILSISNS